MELKYTIIFENDYEEMEKLFNGKKWKCYLPNVEDEEDECLQIQTLTLNECLKYLENENDIYIVRYKDGRFGLVGAADFEPFDKHIVLMKKVG